MWPWVSTSLLCRVLAALFPTRLCSEELTDSTLTGQASL